MHRRRRRLPFLPPPTPWRPDLQSSDNPTCPPLFSNDRRHWVRQLVRCHLCVAAWHMTSISPTGGRIRLARKIIKWQSMITQGGFSLCLLDITLDNIQTGGRGLNDARYESGERTEWGERRRRWSGNNNNNNNVATTPTTHINVSATGDSDRWRRDVEEGVDIHYWVLGSVRRECQCQRMTNLLRMEGSAWL